MRDRSLGEVLTLDRDPVTLEDDQIYATVGIYSYGRGLFERPLVTGSETSYSTYYKLNHDQFVYSKLFAWEGALAVVDQRFAGKFVSQEFPTFKINCEFAIPEYVALLCSWPETWTRVRTGETGMGGRRKRVHPDRLLEVVLPFPTLEEQRRIADLIGTVDTTRRRARELAAAAREAWEVVVGDLEAQCSTRVTVGQVVVSIEPGRSPTADDRLPSTGESAVLKVSAVGRNEFVPDEVKTLPPGVVLPSSMMLRSGDILMTRASGVIHRVGQVCRVEEAPDRYYLCDKTLRLVPSGNVDPDWLTIALLAPGARRQIEATTTGSDMRNISQTAIRSVKIALPPIKDQQRLAALAKALSGTLDRARKLEYALANARQALLDSLLLGESTIAQEYDALPVSV
jgi:type I restriction enzyme, S subunit